MVQRQGRLKGGCSHDWLPHKSNPLWLILALMGGSAAPQARVCEMSKVQEAQGACTGLG